VRSGDGDLTMRLLGNIIWFITGGWLLFLVYLFAAILFFPMFLPLLRVARYALWPFGQDVVTQDELDEYRTLRQGVQSDSGLTAAGNALGGLGNLLWMLTFGWVIALIHLLAVIVNLGLIWLIVTIPNIGGNWKLMGVAFRPFNKVIVPAALAQEIRENLARSRLGI